MKKLIVLGSFLVMLSACSGSGNILQTVGDVLSEVEGGGQAVTDLDIQNGLKEALTKGLIKGVNVVSKENGYFSNPKIKIPWPDDVKKVETRLRSMGLDKQVDKVVLTLNRAAEEAATKAKPIFLNAIKQMTFSDAMNILKGENNAATNFLKRTTTNQLTAEFRPVIDNALQSTNGTKYWGDIINTYNKIPLVEKVNPDLTGFVTGKAMDGLFTMVEKEELKIRKDPVARTTELLKKVFALQDK